MTGVGPTELAIAGWLVLLAGAAVARTRFMMLLRGNRKAYDLGRVLRRVEPRQGVVTVVAVHVPGLKEALQEDPRLAGVVLPTLYDPARVAAKVVGAEVELPGLDGLTFYLGRFQPDPTHRESGLELALKLRELLVDAVTKMGLKAPGIGVATDEVAALPFEVGEATQVLTLGAGVLRARALAAGAEPGEVRVDARRGCTDQGFVFEEIAEEGASRLQGKAEPEEGEAAAPDAPPEGDDPRDPEEGPSTPPGDEGS
jgi:hypothetical protein